MYSEKYEKEMYNNYFLIVFNKEMLKEACTLIVLYFPTVLIFCKKSDETVFCHSQNWMSLPLKYTW